MLWIHPTIQLFVTLLAVYVLYMGLMRFAFVYLGVKARFPWKRHVFTGQLAMLGWAVGMVLGILIVHLEWGVIGITELHYKIALAMVPLLVFGFATGWILRKPTKKRPTLALAHGVVNLLLCGLALFQFYAGLQVLRNFILGA